MGHYIWASKCTKCPSGTVLNTTSTKMGVTSCVACGPNLRSVEGVLCVTDGRVNLTDDHGKTTAYDFSALENQFVLYIILETTAS